MLQFLMNYYQTPTYERIVQLRAPLIPLFGEHGVFMFDN